jgi:serine/threonine protein kinase
VDQIGRYRVLGELGRGATGVVYRAQDPAIGRIIAIKTIRLSDFTDPAERQRLRERLFREAQSAGILSHPNIVTIYDIAEENELAYIFMECVDGPPLEKILNSPQPIASDIALSLLKQTAMALDYAHQKGIVHRDIKPANILIHERADVKITDFGVARIMSQQMTQSGVMMGTPNYMSPEQVQGHAVDGRADQFSLAVIAYEILTGEKPFQADQLPALLFRIVREDPVPPQRLNSSIGPQVEAALKKALAKSPNDRYATCTQFFEALARALQASPGWRPLPRSSAHSMPTMGGPMVDPRQAGARPSPPLPVLAPSSAALPEAHQPRRLDQTDTAQPVVFREEARKSNPLLRSLVWMLVGIGLIGLVLFGAQKYLFNRNSDLVASDAQTGGSPAANTPAANTPAADSSTAKPSPVGQSAAPDNTTKPAASSEPAPPPAATAPETTPSAPEASAPAPNPPAAASQAPVEPKSHERPPRDEVAEQAKPAIATNSGAGQSVQFLTEPAGAQVVVDGNSSSSCKTPCVLSLPGGRHALTVQMAGYRPYPRVFNVPDDGDIFLKLNKAVGTVNVTSEPPGASIELDGKVQPERTPAVFNLIPGTYHIKVEKGHAFLDFDVQVHDGEFITRRVTF